MKVDRGTDEPLPRSTFIRIGCRRLGDDSNRRCRMALRPCRDGKGTRVAAGERTTSMEDLQVAARGSVATLVLNRPAKRNAITLEMWKALPAVLGDLASDPATRVLLIRGAGGEAFAAGADISEVERLRKDAASGKRYSQTVEQAERALAASPRPTIAMIHGSCA